MAIYSTYTQTLTVSVANGAAITFPYVAPDVQASFNAADTRNQAFIGQALVVSPAATFAAAGGGITVTNATGAAWPAGTTTAVTMYWADQNDVTPGAAVAALTNSSGGTSGGNTIAAVTDVPTAANAVATLAVKVNALIASLKAAGFLS
jgi:outer membrane murein-binding lipoprotein Lpp